MPKQDYGTIKIPQTEFDRHNERRQEMGLTWAEYIDGEAPDYPDVVDEEEIARAVVAGLRGPDTSWGGP